MLLTQRQRNVLLSQILTTKSLQEAVKSKMNDKNREGQTQQHKSWPAFIAQHQRLSHFRKFACGALP